ncbi:MAG TPA: zf-HC2 domain-containing protein [Vicinamibacteria bacterium]|nr:zf-HC2 domain-containing protein [Vicinamibacteria bacterium]
MVDDREHPRNALQDALDGRLDPAAQAKLESHLASCPDCRRELQALRWTKAQASAARSLPPSSDLEARLRAALDEEDRAPGSRSGGVAGRIAPWIAAAAVLVAAVWLGVRFFSASTPALLAAEFRAYSENEISLDWESSDARELETLYERASLPFRMTVYDLGMMGYRIEGAAARPFRGRGAGLVVYRGSDGSLLICRMYEGRVTDLPEPLERRVVESVPFWIYREGDVNLVFWQEGPVVCVLLGEGDVEAIVALAVAKASKP